jgi:hypothetical protein
MGIAKVKRLTSETRDYLFSFGGKMSTTIFSTYLNKLGEGTCQVHTSSKCPLVVKLNLYSCYSFLSRFSDLHFPIASKLLYGPAKESQLGGVLEWTCELAVLKFYGNSTFCKLFLFLELSEPCLSRLCASSLSRARV